MKRLKAWQVVLLVIFYPVGIAYLIYRRRKKRKYISLRISSSVEPVNHTETYVNYTQRPAGFYDKKSKIVSLWTRKWLEMAANEFVVIDLETTGLDKSLDRIVEISAIRYCNCVETEKFVTLVNPCCIIPTAAVNVHHITDNMVRTAPIIEDVLPALLDFLGDSLLAGHNVNFDIAFIEIAARLQGFNPEWNYIDSMSIAKKMIPGLPNYKQTTILNALNIKQNQYHRAEDDCRGCAEIILLGINSLV